MSGGRIIYPSEIFTSLEVVNINGNINFTTDVVIESLTASSITNGTMNVSNGALALAVTNLLGPFVNDNQAVNKQYVDESYQFNPSGSQGSVQFVTNTSITGSNIIWTSSTLYAPNIYTTTTAFSSDSSLILGSSNPVNLSGFSTSIGLILPNTQGLNNTVLKITAQTGTQYQLSWVSNDAIVSGPLNSLQFNHNSQFTGSSDLTFSSNILTCSGSINALTSSITGLNAYELNFQDFSQSSVFSIVPSTNVISNYTLTFPPRLPDSTALFTNGSGNGLLTFTTSTSSGILPSDPLNSIQIANVLATTTGTPSSVTLQDLTFTTVDNVGPDLQISIEYIGGAVAGSEQVLVNETLTGYSISVLMQSGVSTASNIKNALDSNVDSSALILTTVSGTASAVQTGTGLHPLTGGGVGYATLVLQDLTYTSVDLGGNDIAVSYIGGSTAGSEVVNVINDASGKYITVTIEDTVSTAQQIYDAINLSVDALALVSVAISGTSGNTQNITSFNQTSTSSSSFLAMQGIDYSATSGNNNIVVEYIGGGTAGSEGVTGTTNSLVVQIDENVSTAQNVYDALIGSGQLVNVDITFSANLTSPGDFQVAQGPTNLSGGFLGNVTIQDITYTINPVQVPSQFIIQYIAGPLFSGVSSNVNGSYINITFVNDFSTADDIITEVTNNLFLYVTAAGSGSTQTVTGFNYLSGGQAYDTVIIQGVKYTANTYGTSGIVIQYIDKRLAIPNLMRPITVYTQGSSKFITIAIENNVSWTYDISPSFNSVIAANTLATASTLFSYYPSITGLSLLTGGSPNKYYDVLLSSSNLLWNDGVYLNNIIVSTNIAPRIDSSLIVPNTVSYLTSNLSGYCFATGSNTLTILKTDIWNLYTEVSANASTNASSVIVSTSAYSGIIKTISINNYLYVLSTSALYISSWRPFTIQQSNIPTTLSTITQSNLKDLFVSNNYVYMTSTNALLIADISSPLSPTTLSTLSFTSAGPLYKFGSNLYVGDSVGLWSVNIQNALSPYTIGYLSNTPIFAFGSNNNYLYASTTNSLLEIDSTLSVLRTITISGVNKFITIGYNVYCIINSNTLGELNLLDSSSVISATTISGISSLTYCGNRVYVGANTSFKQINVYGNKYTSSYVENLNGSNMICEGVTIEGCVTVEDITTNSLLVQNVVFSKREIEIPNYSNVELNTNAGKITITDPDIIIQDGYEEIIVACTRCYNNSIIKCSVNIQGSSGFPTVSVKDISNGSFTIVITNKSEDIMSGAIEVFFVVF